MNAQTITLLFILGLVGLHAYFRPNIDIQEDSVIIHYFWRGIRKTYILK